MYTKINVSKVFELRKDLGLIVEVNQGANGKPNDIVLWLQYKDDVGQWQYKGSKGATGIRIPIVDGLEKFLLEVIKASIDSSNKFNASNKAITKGKIDINALSDDMKADLLKALLKAGKEETKEEPKEESAITLENVLSLLSPTKETKKGKGKK